MVILAFGAMVANVALSVINAAMLWAFGDYLRGQLIKANNKLKPGDKNKDTDYTPKEVNHDLHSWLTSGLVQAVIFGFLLMLLAVNFRRGKGWARWATILVLFLVVRAPFRLLGLGGDTPFAVNAMSALIGLTGVAVVVLLLLPESARYFAAVRAANAGGGASRGSGAAPVGLRGMFAPRPRPAVKPDADAAPPASPPQKRAAPPGQKRAAPSGQKPAAPRAKARASADAAAAKPSAPAKNRGKSRKGP